MTANSAHGHSPRDPRAGIFIKPHGVELPSDTSSMEAPEIMALLRSLDADGTRRAGERFSRLGTALNEIAVRIAGHSDHLARHWRGRAAAGAMRTFQDMHDYAATLAAQATQTGEVLKWMGNDVLPRYQHLPDPSSVHGVTREHANTAARTYLKSLSDHVIAANKAMPSRIVGTPSSPHAGARRTAVPAVSSPNPFPGGSGPVTSPGTSSPVPPRIHPRNGPFPAAQLQSAGPALPTAPAPPVSGLPAPSAGGPGGVSVMPVMPAGAGGGSAGMAGETPAASAAGAAGAGSEASAAGAAGSEEGLAAAPMMGGAGSQQEQERQRYAWMNDDDDIWGVPAEGQPPVIG